MKNTRPVVTSAFVLIALSRWGSDFQFLSRTPEASLHLWDPFSVLSLLLPTSPVPHACPSLEPGQVFEELSLELEAPSQNAFGFGRTAIGGKLGYLSLFGDRSGNPLLPRPQPGTVDSQCPEWGSGANSPTPRGLVQTSSS